MCWQFYIDFMKADEWINEAIILNREGIILGSNLDFFVGSKLPSYKIEIDDDYEDVKVIKDYDESKALIEGINSKGYWEYHASIIIN